MPPKKKGKGKGKQKGAAVPDGDEVQGSSEPTEKEALLQQELDQLTEDLVESKKSVDELRKENEWLQQEAHKVRVESHEYMSYMEKKTHKRQSTIISLSDHNQKEIRDIQREKENMLQEYEQKKSALRDIRNEKENLLSKTKYELQNLQEYKNLQTEQLTRIKELEREVMVMRGKHSDAIQQLKAHFLLEKRSFQQDSEMKIQAMAKQANQEAIQCLNDHTQQIKLQNRQLRHELLLLIRKTRALYEHKKHLEEQKQELLMEQQYAQDLKTLRTARQHKVLKSFGLIDEQDHKQPSDNTEMVG